MMDAMVKASFHSEDPCKFHLEHSVRSSCELRAEAPEHAAALVEKINLTGAALHTRKWAFERCNGDLESEDKKQLLFDQEGWGGNDGESHAKLYDAGMALGIDMFNQEPGGFYLS